MLDYKVITFLKVCDTMNFTRAAEELNITQPAVSRHIHCLEDEYGVRLFDYKKKRISLTPAGMTLKSYAVAMKNDEIIIAKEIAAASDKRKELRFGTTKTISDFAVAKPLQAYMKSHVDTDIHMIVANTEYLITKLNSGDINFALVEGYYDPKEFESVKYSTEDFIAICAKDHKFAVSPKNVKDLLGESLIVREKGSGTRDILEKNLESKNLSINDFSRVIEIGSMHVITSLIAGDSGISFMYKAAALNGIENGLLREIKLNDFSVKHDFTFIWNRGSVLAETYKEVCGSFLNCR